MRTTVQAEQGQPPVSHSNAALGTLFLGTFVLGAAELLVVGILPLIARDMAVSISTAGTLVTANALGIAIGGSLLTALSIHVSRRLLTCGSRGNRTPRPGRR